jgi:glutathione S-transferase
MSIELYSGPLSLFSARVQISLDDKSIPFELIDVPWTADGGWRIFAKASDR